MQPINQHPFNEALKERHENLIVKAHVRYLKVSKPASTQHAAMYPFRISSTLRPFCPCSLYWAPCSS